MTAAGIQTTNQPDDLYMVGIYCKNCNIVLSNTHKHDHHNTISLTNLIQLEKSAFN